jgi:hypothetical protein
MPCLYIWICIRILDLGRDDSNPMWHYVCMVNT